MKVKDIIIRLLDEPMDAEIKLCTDWDKEKDEEAIIQLRLGPGINEDVSEKYNDAVNIAIEALNDITKWRTWSHTYDNAAGRMTDLIIKGAGDITDGLYVIKDGELFKYKNKGGTVRTYPIMRGDQNETSESD